MDFIMGVLIAVWAGFMVLMFASVNVDTNDLNKAVVTCENNGGLKYYSAQVLGSNIFKCNNGAKFTEGKQ